MLKRVKGLLALDVLAATTLVMDRVLRWLLSPVAGAARRLDTFFADRCNTEDDL